MTIETLKEKVLHGEHITRDEAIFLADQPLEALCSASDDIRKNYCNYDFDLCAVISVKGGQC